MFTIYTGMQISAVQSIFHATFPYLKLEFFKLWRKFDKNQKEPLHPSSATLNHIGNQPEPAITISETMTVAAVVQLFKSHFGLDVQVLRKSRKTWLETSVTNDWTLKKQNDQGEELSRLAAGQCDDH